MIPDKNKIAKTLSENPITPEMVFAACEQIAAEFLTGGLAGELAPLLKNMDQETIWGYLGKFGTWELKKRLERELAPLYGEKDVLVCPKGVLFHISAGNMDALPAYSVLEGLLTGNINLLKLPSEDHGLSRFLLEKLMEYQPVLRDYIYIFDLPSQDLEGMRKLMDLANAIILWGSDEAVSQVRRYVPINTEIIEWGHKLSFAYIQKLNIPDEPLQALARHILSTNQLLCNSCQGIYLDTEDETEVSAFARRFAGILEETEAEYPLPDYLQGKLTLEALTRKLENRDGREEVCQNTRSSVCCKKDGKLELSGLFGNVWVKPLPQEKIVENLWENRLHLQTAGVYPFGRELAHIFARAGLTNICEISRMSEHALRKTHDGCYALARYVRLVEMTGIEELH